MGCPQSWNVKKLDLDHMSPSRKITFLLSRVSFVCSKVGHLASYNLTFQKRGICLVNSISHIWATNQIQIIRYPLEDGLEARWIVVHWMIRCAYSVEWVTVALGREAVAHCNIRKDRWGICLLAGPVLSCPTPAWGGAIAGCASLTVKNYSE